MQRRQFLAYGTAGLAGAVASSFLPPVSAVPAHAQSGPRSLRFDLTMQSVDQEMVDGTRVPMLAFADLVHGASIPGPVLRVREGDVVEVRLTNATGEPRAFAVPGVPAATSRTVPPGGSDGVSFVAPAGGTYLYLDPSEAPLARLLGLHGALVVLPRDGRTAAGKPTPYSLDQIAGTASHRAISALFDALGGPYRFPGDAWNPDDPAREHVWLLHQVDPSLNAAAAEGRSIDPQRIAASFLPRYFTINGVSGFDAAERKANVPTGYIGQPTLIRVLNAGLATHSPHIHGNDVFELSGVGPAGEVVVLDNIVERDTWSMPPLARKDVLLPFEQPLDIPAAAFPPRDEPFPLVYPMHCHTEMSQTAAGGSYPQGLVTDWKILGPLRTTQAAATGNRG